MLFRRFLVPAFLLMLSTPAMAQEIHEAPSGELIANHIDGTFQTQMRMNDLASNYFPKIDKIENDESPKDDNILHSRYKANNCNPDLDPIHCAWQKESDDYKTAGIGLSISGTILVSSAILLYNIEIWNALATIAGAGGIEDESADENIMLSAHSLLGVGAPLLLTGLILIIYDAVKFAPYRKANADAQAIRWSPDLIVTPDYQGIGLDFRF